MLKNIVVFLMILACCYCLENGEVLEEARTKKKKGSLKILAIIALAVLSKMAIFKVATFLFLVTFFQKLFYFGGMILNQYMNKVPAQMYGPPEYNTVGYSYDAPAEPFKAETISSLTDIGKGFNWLFNKQP